MTHRRDSINAQLSNVREMLATLAGTAVSGADPAKITVAKPGGPVPTPAGRSSTRA